MENFFSLLTGTTSSLDLMDVIINIILSGVMSWLIYLVFVRFGNTFSNRRHFGYIFFMVGVSTTIIITIIQASLALSLGLVGALSIVRFRTAIKEPEELAYTFFCITMGLGFGANLRGLTVLCGLLVLAVLCLRGMVFQKGNGSDSYNFSVISTKLSLNEVSGIIRQFSSGAALRRVDHEGGMLNANFHVAFPTVERLESAAAALAEKDPSVSTRFVSNSINL